jgi:hypothetical protein
MTTEGIGVAVVAGGTGLVGSRLVRALAAQGTEVTVLTRSGAPALPPGARAASWEDAEVALAGADALFNFCGAGIADRRWSVARKWLLEDSRVGPTLRLARALAQLPAPPRVLVNASAVGIYGSLGQAPVDESQEPGQGFLPDLCRDWEAAAATARANHVRVVLLRMGVVLAREGGALPRMAMPVRLFLGSPLGHGRQGMSWIHADDLVRLCLAAAADPAWAGPINATAPNPVSNEEFTSALARRLRRPVLPAPAWLTRTALDLALGEMGRTLLLDGAFVLPRKALELGFQFWRPNLEDALATLYPS